MQLPNFSPPPGYVLLYFLTYFCIFTSEVRVRYVLALPRCVPYLLHVLDCLMDVNYFLLLLKGAIEILSVSFFVCMLNRV